MARKIELNNKSRATPVAPNSVPKPPSSSSIAVQLVEQHSRAEAQDQPQNRAAFSQLLHELRECPTAIDSDIQDNSKLISVIAEAGFGAVVNNDYLTLLDAVDLSEILACLDVIESAIKRTPEVIVHCTSGTDETSSDVCSILLPKLFALLKTGKHEPAKSRVTDLLGLFLTALSHSIKHSNSLSLMVFIYQVTVDDALHAVETHCPHNHKDQRIELLLLSPEARSRFHRESAQVVASRRSSQLRVSEPQHMFVIITSLLWSLSNLLESAHIRALMNNILGLEMDMWMLKGYQRLQFSFNNVLLDPGNSEAMVVVVSTLEALVSFAAYVLRAEGSIDILRKVARLIASFLGHLFHGLVAIESMELQTQVNAILAKILHLTTDCDVVFVEIWPVFLLQLPGFVSGFSLPAQLREPLRGTVSKFRAMMLSERRDGNTAPMSDEQRRVKKIRINVDQVQGKDDDSPHISLFEKMCRLFGAENIPDRDDLARSAADRFGDMQATQRTRFLEESSAVFCACLQSPPTSQTSAPEDPKCDACCNSCRGPGFVSLWNGDDWEWLHMILSSVLEASISQASQEHRVLAMMTVRAFSSHSPIAQHRDLGSSIPGIWCLQSLRSSSRELRLAAMTTLQGFLRPLNDADLSICRRNRVRVMEFLRGLADTNEHRFHEVSIMVMGQIANLCDDEERNIILLRLVDYLGHANTLISTAANVELRNMAQICSLSLQDLFKPFWRTVAITAVKDLILRPQKAQQLAELLGMSVSQLLNITQAETVPWLVLWGKQDVLSRIASAQSGISSIWSICMQKQNLPALIGMLVVQEPTQLEASVLRFLVHASPEFKNLDVSHLLRSDAVPIACEILKISSEEETERRVKAMQAFRQFAAVVERKPRGSSSLSELTAAFFEKHALGMMTTFSDTIESPSESNLEKKRSLRAIEAMIEIGEANIRIALPQVRASLQSALESKVLRDQAFNPWAALLRVVNDEDDLEALIDYTFTAIVQHWDEFESSTQQTAYDSIATLLKNHGSIISNSVQGVPSLGSIPLMSKFETQLAKLRNQLGIPERLSAFARRCRSENPAIVLYALRELSEYLETTQSLIHESSVAEQPFSAIPELIRVLLDICSRQNEEQPEILISCGRCLGIIGSLDANRIEAPREKRRKILMLTNFNQATEAVDFVSYLLEHVLVKAFHSVSNPRAQGFLAYVMQELLSFCGFSKDSTIVNRIHSSQAGDVHDRWHKMSESARNTLYPFLTSRYVLKTATIKASSNAAICVFNETVTHGTWIRTFVSDLLRRPKGDNAQMVFGVLSRIIRGFDVSIAAFLLPYALANVILGGIRAEVLDISNELLRVLECPTDTLSRESAETVKLCSENVFQVLDYLSEWLQDKKKAMAAARATMAKSGRERSALDEETDGAQIESIESIFSAIPANVIAKRAVECGSYARALFYWEEYIRQQKSLREVAEQVPGRSDNLQDGGILEESRSSHMVNNEVLYQHLHNIYAQIDEPDGLSGISNCLHVLTPEQQIMEYRSAGRWAAAQTWYELRLREEPESLDIYVQLLGCLQQAGQYSAVLERAKSMPKMHLSNSRIQAIVSEAAWSTETWNVLSELSSKSLQEISLDVNVGIGAALSALHKDDNRSFFSTINSVRLAIARSLTASATDSLQTCHDQILKLHALYELELLTRSEQHVVVPMQQRLNQRLAIVGTSVPDKQYLLNIRRAVMSLSKVRHRQEDIAASWLLSAKLARKSYQLDIAYDAVLNSMQLGSESARVEHARLLWAEGKHRNAIRYLESAITTTTFETSPDVAMSEATSMVTTAGIDKNGGHNLVLAKAQLLLAKWLDKAGQTQSNIINIKYQSAVKSYPRWENGYYYLGKFYNKLLESEKALPPGKQGYVFLIGDGAKLVIENFLRSMMFGSKYLFETLPKILTLWLDFGVEAGKPLAKDISDDIRRQVTEERPKTLDTINKQIKKYVDRIPPYLYYTALPQMVTRISHPHPEVYKLLASMIVKIVVAFPQQGLWPLLALAKSSTSDRASRGFTLLGKVKEKGKNIRNEGQSIDLKNLVAQGQRLCDQLLHACEVELKPSTPSIISLTKDLGFNLKVFPCGLVIPLEKTLFANLPTTKDIKQHKAFPATRDAITFSSCMDEVNVLSSLQKPRKLTFRATDGRKYAIMIKPKDDLRKDQRLMEFNTFVNRSLRKDAESSKRRLYIKTYAVTPLNEECGLIEWVDGLKALRDIISNLYKSKNIRVDYNLLKQLLDEACATPEGHRIFSQQILSIYKPVLHEWFTEQFPTAEAWFAARLRFTRSCAVTSMLGYVLGLGDRHGENVLLEEKDGGVFHVDFNCLFEKGLTFDKPETVPFRLTQNMVDAFGAYGVEGPFRRCAECAMSVMRGSEDALLTILETFVYDPTADFMGPGPRRKAKGVPETPKEMLDSVKGKIGGLMRGESVPLSVEGHVDALIRQATDPANLCAMYIGWCAFL